MGSLLPLEDGYVWGRKVVKAERDGKRDIREGTENDSAFGRK
jgi:hypothetical protein